MTESANRKKDTSGIRVVSSLPELVNLIGQHLSPSDLVACVRVCRLWNHTLLPLVWHTVNPKRGAWRQYKLEQWVRTSFNDNCHLVRDLTADWDVLLETATRKCRNLTSLTVHTVTHILPKRFYFSSPSSSSAAGSPTANYQALPLELPWISNHNNDVHQETYQKCRDIEWFWQIVLQNPGLVRLQLPQTTIINILSQAYILETISRIRNLRELSTKWMNVDLSTVLDTLPQLERLECSPYWGSVTLSRDYSNLRQLKYFSSFQVSRFIEVLKHLPKLESLELSRVIPEESPPTSTYEILCEKVSTTGVMFPQVREFRVLWMSPHEERYAMVMLGLFPELRRLWLPTTFGDIRKVMWERCYWLEEIKDRRDGVVDEWKERRAKNAAAGVRL